MIFCEVLQAWHKPQRREARRRVHMQRIAYTLSCVVGGRTDGSHGSAYPFEVIIARNGEVDVMCGAIKQADIQELLKFGHLVADGRGGEMQFFRRAGKIPSAGYGFKGCEACKRGKR